MLTTELEPRYQDRELRFESYFRNHSVSFRTYYRKEATNTGLVPVAREPDSRVQREILTAPTVEAIVEGVYEKQRSREFYRNHENSLHGGSRFCAIRGSAGICE